MVPFGSEKAIVSLSHVLGVPPTYPNHIQWIMSTEENAQTLSERLKCLRTPKTPSKAT